nr:plasmid pRiA4b ORF-3 family protein [Gemmatimonadaceae bacterium]
RGRRPTYRVDDNEMAEGEAATTARLLSVAAHCGDAWIYRYDFGDDWVHDLVIEEIVPSSAPPDARWPRVLDGERAGPPEDCGGPPGLAALLEQLTKPRTRAGREMRAWVGPHYDPARFDVWIWTGR